MAKSFQCFSYTCLGSSSVPLSAHGDKEDKHNGSMVDMLKELVYTGPNT